MSLGPLVPQNSEGSHELQPAVPAEFLRPLNSGLYNVLPSQESMLREYMRVLIKRKYLVVAVVVGIFMAVAMAVTRTIRLAVGRTQVRSGSGKALAV